MNKGFTLIELMVVVTIIGILSAIGLPQYRNYIARAQVVDAINSLEDLKSSAMGNLETGTCTGLSGNQIDIMSGKYGNYFINGISTPSQSIVSTDETGCILFYEFKNKDVSPQLKSKVIAIMLMNNGTLSLLPSYSPAVDKKLLPKAFQ